MKLISCLEIVNESTMAEIVGVSFYHELDLPIQNWFISFDISCTKTKKIRSGNLIVSLNIGRVML